MTTSRTSHRETTRRTAALAWQVLAGTLVATGVITVEQESGPVSLLLVSGGLWAFCSVTLYGVFSEAGTRVQDVARWGLVSTVATVTLLGLCVLTPTWGAVAAAAGAVTSPPVRPYVARGWARLRPALRPTRSSRAPDQARIDREFAQIVEWLEQDR